MKKYGILSKYHEDQWDIYLGKATYIEVISEVNLIEALDEVSKLGWEVVNVFIEDGRQKALVSMDIKQYESEY